MITGSLVAIVTPMKSGGGQDGHLDFGAFKRLIDWHVEEGTDGIVVVGTTGESPTVNVDEHKELIRVAVQHSRGRIPIIAGTGDDRDAPARMLDRDPDQLLVLVDVDRRRLAGGAHHHDAVGPLLDMPVDQPLEGPEVEVSVLPSPRLHRGDDGNQAAGNHAGILTLPAGSRMTQMRCTTAFFGRSTVPCSNATTPSVANASSSSPGRSKKFGFDGLP